MKKIKYFFSVNFYVENEFKEILFNYLENHNYFLCINYKKKRKCESSNFWFVDVLFYDDVNLKKLVKDINFLRKGINLFLYKIDKEKKSFRNISFKKVRNQDWLNNNKNILKPLLINNYFIYDDEYHSFKHRPLIPVKIKASYAFGSGYHETTKNCIKAISFIVKRKKINNLIDYGAGTGILGICFQKKIHSSSTIFIDNDESALKLTKFNLRKNNLRNQGNVFLTSKGRNKYYKKQNYDVVLANILFKPLKILVKDFNYILKKQSYLIISGILEDQKRFLINKYRMFNFFIYKIYNEKNWITIIFKRK